MANVEDTTPNRLTLALQATFNLCRKELNNVVFEGNGAAMVAHSEIETRPVNQKSVAFYRQFLPLRGRMVNVLSESFRRYFKLGLANPSDIGSRPEDWALVQLQPAVSAGVEWLRDWFVLACEGENQHVRRVASIPYVPGATVSAPIPLNLEESSPTEVWRAPCWLFQVSIALVGIGLLKTKHVPAIDSEEKLSVAHTRLLLKGARRVFLWELNAAIETVWNEEVSAAATIPAGTPDSNKATERESKRRSSKPGPRGTEGLRHKPLDLSRYMDGLTEKQQLAFSLKHEYRLGLAEIASRMGLDRKTAYEHIKAAERKIDQARSSDKRRRSQFKTGID